PRIVGVGISGALPLYVTVVSASDTVVRLFSSAFSMIAARNAVASYTCCHSCGKLIPPGL
ncbi:MAG: hypothetical protein IJH41_07335, partial [Eubacterium sp.]|nr:hypothetical protein [Eubacterium sp.]